MDDATIKRILPILASADGGCISCGTHLISDFGKEFHIPREHLIALFHECKIDVYWADRIEGELYEW